MDMEVDCYINGIEIFICNEFEIYSVEVYESIFQKVKRKRGRLRKSLLLDDQGCVLLVFCFLVSFIDDVSIIEDNNIQCEDG